MQCVCGAVGAAAGWGAAAAPASSPANNYTLKNKSFQSAFVRYAAINTKKTTRCGILRLSRTMLEQRGQNFGAGKILPKNPIFPDISRDGNSMNLIDMLIKSVRIGHNNSVYKVVIS